MLRLKINCKRVNKFFVTDTKINYREEKIVYREMNRKFIVLILINYF